MIKLVLHTDSNYVVKRLDNIENWMDEPVYYNLESLLRNDPPINDNFDDSGLHEDSVLAI
jgi:hypothetical protein